MKDKEKIRIMAENHTWGELEDMADMLWFMYETLGLNTYEVWDFVTEAQIIREEMDFPEL